MYYKLNEALALRGWDGAPYAVRHLPSGTTEFLSEAQFGALSFCDGNFDCDGAMLTPAHKQFISLAAKNGAAVPCQKGETVTEKQRYQRYSCQYVAKAHWSITGKCNMRCRHCYMSAPQAKYGEISHEMAMDIIVQLAGAGISTVSLTGGEPLVREDFWDIVDELRGQDIVVDQIYTNGLLVNGALLDGLEARGMKPEFSLSFDGVGWHDWLRGFEGAEETAINAIRLLRSRGFDVSVESAFHRDSIGTMEDTMRLLADLGVRAWKTNPVAGSGNWLNAGRDLDLTVDELYDAYLALIPEYFAADAPLSIQLGGFFQCKKGSRNYGFPCNKTYRDEAGRLREPLCMSARHMMYISADARLLPCIPLSGLPVQDGFPSLYDVGIAEALSRSVYLERVNAPISKLFEHKPECASCEHRLHCNGGCRAAALMENGGSDYFGIDSWTCRFFKGGYEEKINAVIAGGDDY